MKLEIEISVADDAADKVSLLARVSQRKAEFLLFSFETDFGGG
jgi:hypothetical protein